MSTEHYECVTYWYGIPAATLIKTDYIDIGNSNSEKAHNYVSTNASNVYKVTSRFEMGINVFPDNPWRIDKNQIKGYQSLEGKEVYPDETMDGRYTKGTSEFTINIVPENQGILLRRTLDYSFPNQTAEVFVADDNEAEKHRWKHAGTWYLAGSNTCMFSDPRTELGARFTKTQTSNRQLRDDEFMIPENITHGVKKLRVKIKYIPNTQDLFPGTPFPNQSAWSELGYEVYTIVKTLMLKGNYQF
ncbi:MAG: hypothetical protein HC905_06105 [Bacteroidales bacterium]|nr:hypothetical protein [Bacteroidales bacterium]